MAIDPMGPLVADDLLTTAGGRRPVRRVAARMPERLAVPARPRPKGVLARNSVPDACSE